MRTLRTISLELDSEYFQQGHSHSRWSSALPLTDWCWRHPLPLCLQKRGFIRAILLSPISPFHSAASFHSMDGGDGDRVPSRLRPLRNCACTRSPTMDSQTCAALLLDGGEEMISTEYEVILACRTGAVDAVIVTEASAVIEPAGAERLARDVKK